MEKNKNDRYIVMFLTDGQGNDDFSRFDASMTASQRIAKFKEDYNDFAFHAIQFGGGQHSPALIKMAAEGGDNPIKDATMPSDLGNFFISTVAREIDVSLMHGFGS